MATELREPVVPTSLTSADENLGLSNGIVIKSTSDLTELDRVSPGYYKRTSMPSAFIPAENGHEVPLAFYLFLFYFINMFTALYTTLLIYLLSFGCTVRVQTLR